MTMAQSITSTRPIRRRQVTRAPRTIAALCALVALAATVAAAAERCAPERKVQMDTCAVKLGFLGDRSFTAPKNLSESAEFCRELKSSITCVQAYARDCLQGFTRQLMTSLLKRAKQQHSFVCQGAPAQSAMIARMACITDSQIGQLHTTMDASVARFEYIASKRVGADIKMQALCCSYQIFQREMDASLDRVCPEPRAQRRGSTHEFIERVVSGTAGEFMGLICDQYRTLDDCKHSKKMAAHLNSMEDITSQVNAGSMHPKSKSLVSVLLEILEAAAAR